ncbi:MAG: histidine phosphatase family protein [Vicinamibacterales bacterium]
MSIPPIALLIRHAHTDASDLQLAGRTPAIHLSQRGTIELQRVRDQLVTVPLEAVYSSPLARARDTAEPVATDHGLGVDVEDDLNEVDFGDWTGATFAALGPDPRWHAFNAHRSTAIVPNGERPADVQRRAVMLLTRLAARHPHGNIALVSHAEVIRSAVLWFAGRSLDDFHQVAIDTASVTAILMSSTPRVLFVNAVDGCDAIARY